MRISDWSSDLCSSDLSGSLTHNLFEFRHSLNDPEYAQTFADWIAAAVIRGDVQSLLQYRERAPHAVRAHPTEEHFLPLLVRSEEHTSELQSLMRSSYAVFCLKTKTTHNDSINNNRPPKHKTNY